MAVRLSASLNVLFLTLFCLLFCGGRSAKRAYVGLLPAKLCSWALLFTTFLFLENKFFNPLLDPFMYLSIIWLVFQSIAVIDFAYNWNESWVAYEGRSGNTAWLVAIVGVSVLLLMASIVATVSMLGSTTSPLCRVCVLVGLAIALVLASIGVTDFIPHGALLPGVVFVAYTVFSLWCAVVSWPAHEASDCAWMWRKRCSIGLAVVCFVYNSVANDVHLVTATGTQSPTTETDDTTNSDFNQNIEQWFCIQTLAFCIAVCSLSTNWSSQSR